MPEQDTVTDRGQHSDAGEPLPPPAVAGESVELREDTGGRVQPVSQPLTVVTSAQPLAVPITDQPAVSGARRPAAAGGRVRIGDRVMSALTAGSAWFVILLVVLIAVFLLIKSLPSIADDKSSFFTSTDWDVTPGNLHFGIAALLWVTVIISVIALIVAVPIAIGIALFITHYAPRRIAKPVAYVIDLLAAIPSIVYGIWGALVLAPKLEPVQRFLSHIPLPLFELKHPTRTIFDGSVVLAVMVLPIVTAISREVFERTPRANIEAALALGATRWEVVRTAVLPYGRAGVVSGAMLGLGRALGETIAVYLIVATSGHFTLSVFDGGTTFASQIALGSSEFNNEQTTGAYIAAGLVLFVLTFVVNAAARAIVNRKKEFV
jgi:phosphate transport system permease protein